MSEESKVAICGAGAWGTAMAFHLSRQGHAVSLLPRRSEQADLMRESRENRDYLPGFKLPENVSVASSDEDALGGARLVFLGVPSNGVRDWMDRIRGLVASGERRFFVSLAKGLEMNSGKTPCEIIKEALPDQLVGCLSGPTFAGEVAEGKPAAMTLASESLEPIVQSTQEALSGKSMRIYRSEDLKGVELGGCMKNVYAIAAGCCQGLNLGDNALAALLTRTLAEMVRVGSTFGARADTFYGLSGFGDLVATCHGSWSRNRKFGESIGLGGSASRILENQKTAVEGYRTSRSFHQLLHSNGIEAPILEQVYRILYENKVPLEALNDLMNRDLKRESE